VLGPGEIGYQLSGAFYPIPTAQLGNVARVDKIYGNDTTAYIGGLPFLTIQAAITAIIGTGSVTVPQFQNTTIWVLPGTYDIPPTGSNATITDSASVTYYPLLVIPATTGLRGMSLQNTLIRCTAPTQNTVLMYVQPNCRIEDITLTLGDSGFAGVYDLVGVYFNSSTSILSKLRPMVINVRNDLVDTAATTNVYGVQFDGTGTLGVATFSFNSMKGLTVNVYSNGAGKKRGIIVTNTNLASTRDVNVYVAQPRVTSSTGSYVGVETADPANTGSIQLRTTTVGVVPPTGVQAYTASDILQTNPTTITDPTYLASAGIQIGPGVDLVTKTAGGKGFSTYVYPMTLFYGAVGTLNTSGNPGTGTPAHLWPGSLIVHGSGGQFIQYPDITTPPARYRIQQPLILAGISVNVNTAPGTGHTTTITVRKTPVGGSIADTVYSVELSNADTTVRKYDASVNFAAGDLLHVRISYDAAGNATTDVSIQLDLF